MATRSDTARDERCRTLFRERVLPSFPQTKERFERYFKPSCDLLRALPFNGYFKRRLIKRGFPKPIWSRESLRSKSRRLSYISSDLELALTILRIKPATEINMNSTTAYFRKHGKHFPEDAGLKATIIASPDYFKRGKKVHSRKVPELNYWIFDPVLLSPVLSRELNRNVRPEETEKALHELEKVSESAWPNDLYGYPEMTRGDDAGFGLEAKSTGELYGVPYECSNFACKVYTPELIVPTLEGWASAAALIEEIKDLTVTVSQAYLSNYLGDHSKPICPALERIPAKVSIERRPQTGEWLVSKDV